MNLKNTQAARTTITRDVDDLADHTGNIYKSIVVLSKRADQISVDMKEELNRKLDEFSMNSDSLEEVFENREQIEISKYYERLPKPGALAIEELNADQVYVRDIEKTEPEADIA